MKIDRLVLGLYETNCYVLRADEASRNCLIVDTGLEGGPLMDFLNNGDLKPEALILTHGHVDHIVGAAILRKKFSDVKLYIHRLDADMLTNPTANLSTITGASFTTEPADELLDDNSIVESAGITLKVLHTPGHTPGGICLYSEEDSVAFVGDTLFAGSVGRTDFPGGSMPKLIESIKTKLFTLPEETTAYPGHGPETTIGREKQYNPFVR